MYTIHLTPPYNLVGSMLKFKALNFHKNIVSTLLSIEQTQLSRGFRVLDLLLEGESMF